MVIEANKSPGQKLLLTGGGRCNFTHVATVDELVRAFGTKGKFLRHSFYQFPAESVRLFFQKRGLKSKVEDDGCVFPVTDKARDVRDTLLTEAKKFNVHFIFSAKVRSITKQGKYFAIEFNPSPYRRRLNMENTEKVIITTGGLSFPETGSTGDGYKFAQNFGHTIIEPRASLVPLVTHERWPGELAGTSLENVKITTTINNKKVFTTGAMLFTHDGIGGPAALELSRFLTNFLPNEKNPIKIFIDLVAVSSEAEIESMILKQISEQPKKTIANILSEIVPRRVSQVLCGQFDFQDKLYANQLSKDLRKKLLRLIKVLPLSIVRTRPIEEAMVTRGGVSVNEIEPKTMESKICPGLFFAGEVIDVDGPCGGYNLQMCWSTGALAGVSAAQ